VTAVLGIFIGIDTEDHDTFVANVRLAPSILFLLASSDLSNYFWPLFPHQPTRFLALFRIAKLVLQVFSAMFK
jgi:hypothetical protein